MGVIALCDEWDSPSGNPFFVADDARYNFSAYDVVRKGMPTSLRQGFDNEKYIELKTEHLNSVNRRLHSDETLIALSITSATSPVAARVIDGLKQLQGCDAFFSVIISSTDEALYRKLGINVCCEPKYERVSLYHR